MIHFFILILLAFHDPVSYEKQEIELPEPYQCFWEEHAMETSLFPEGILNGR